MDSGFFWKIIITVIAYFIKKWEIGGFKEMNVCVIGAGLMGSAISYDVLHETSIAADDLKDYRNSIVHGYIFPSQSISTFIHT